MVAHEKIAFACPRPCYGEEEKDPLAVAAFVEEESSNRAQEHVVEAEIHAAYDCCCCCCCCCYCLLSQEEDILDGTYHSKVWRLLLVVPLLLSLDCNTAGVVVFEKAFYGGGGGYDR